MARSLLFTLLSILGAGWALAQESPCRITFENFRHLAYPQSIAANVARVHKDCPADAKLALFAIQSGLGVRRHLDMAAQLCRADRPIRIDTNLLQCRLKGRTVEP